MARRATVWPGALVFIKKDKSKDRGREKYLVVKMDNGGDKCWIKKLESQFWQENYLVKLTEIELCPNQSNQDSL